MASTFQRYPTIVLVPGAWSAPVMFRKLVCQLEEVGFTVHVPDLPSNNGSRPPNAGFEEDCETVRAVVQSCVNAKESVLMLMHSYGGAVGTNAIHKLTAPAVKAAGATGGVVAMVYLAGYMLDKGWSIMKVIETSGLLPQLGDVLVIEPDGSCLPTDSVSHLYHDLTPEDQQEQSKAVRHWNIVACNAVIEHATWQEVPTYYVRTTEDRCVPPSFQDIMLDHVKGQAVESGDVEAVAYACGHSIYARYPERCVEAVQMALRDVTGWT